ncbi:MAG: hypothetical protein ACXVXS_16640 [Blastococcus sp.]
MTATGNSARPGSLQEDLLQDLMHTVPLPGLRSAGGRAPAAARTGGGTGRGQAPTVELSVTPTRWTSPSVRSMPGRPGLILRAGPIRVSLSRTGG